jgi:phosphoglycerol transferase MdoB-like AlkP superfamily enzyme
MENYFGIYRRPAFLALCFLLALSASRLFLVWFYWDRVASTDGLGFILAQGIRFDIILLGIVFGPVFLLKAWFHSFAFLRRAGNWIIPVYLGIATALSFFIEASTTSFIAQFDSRPNFLFVEYLKYPREVLATLSGTNLPELIAFTAVAVLLAWLVVRWLRRDPRSGTRVPVLFCILATPVIAILMLAMMYAIYEKTRDASGNEGGYGEMKDKLVLAIILREAGIKRKDQLDPAVPTLHQQKATRSTDKPLNLVIILEESLGADYVGSLGGKDLTPELDKLASQGIWMERLYATGIRSARGIEGVISGFTPTPLQSVLKLADTQTNFFTLASLLEGKGYQTSFIYGGESHFDNMKRFFLNNGFQTVIDQNDFDEPVFRGSWGVSDEDTFNFAHESFDEAGNQPFFSLVFTTSHHEPFDIPENRVSQSEYGPRETSIKYADYALGRYIDKARRSGYWENTVFLIIADHNARVFGSHLVPVERFRIPGLIIGGGIEPRRIPGITSQIDMVPTLLSLIGISSSHPAIGRDLTRPEYAAGAGRALMQFHANQAYMEGEWIIVLRPDKKPMSFRLDSAGDWIWDNTADPVLKRKALAHALWGPMMIRQGAYHQ